MLLFIHPDNPSQNKIDKLVHHLNKGGLVIYPTDTIYAIGCSIERPKAIQALAKLKGVKPEKSNFSLICSDLSDLTNYTKSFDNHIHKAMKRVLPGPFTFILNANNTVPRLFMNKRKTVGIRIPDNNIPLSIVKTLGCALVTTSVHDDDELIEYTTDPELIFEKYGDKVDAVVDGGFGKNEPSTVIDCTNNELEILREGLGDTDLL